MARLRWDDHAWLVVSFAILVAVVAFLSYDVDRQLARTLNAVCTSARAQQDVAVVQLMLTETILLVQADDPDEALADLSAALDGLDATLEDDLDAACGPRDEEGQ